jgi:phytoene dehydrogenase-like protein
MSHYDAIVIGAGHNGLTNAAYLAKAGLNVVVLEKNDYIGGAAVSRELEKGWTYSNCSYVCSMMRQAIHRDLDLARHGLILVPYLATINFGDGDERLIHYHDEEATHLELKRHSPHDADAMHRFQADLSRYAMLIRARRPIRRRSNRVTSWNSCGSRSSSGSSAKKSSTNMYASLR